MRKEGHLKALGTGLALGPAIVHVGLGEKPCPGIVDVEVPRGHAAAVALLRG
ncbi:MAG TPA: hypothetical protein VHG10_11460 [Glycomyces sp.]|nr:hypothetical protein [Glycomyces sp.]